MTTTNHNEPTDEVLDGIAGQLTDALQTPSALARKAGVRTVDAYAALGWLLANQMCVAVGNGCWTKYRARRFGEYR